MSQAEKDLVAEAATGAAALVHSSVATPESDARDTGLMLTKDQVKSLKKYEIAGLALPITLRDVIDYLRYESGAGRGLEAKDFLETFQLVNGHAKLWSPLRQDMLTVNTKLVIFAGNMATYHEGINGIFNDIAALGLIEKHGIKTLEDLYKVEMDLGIKFPDIEAQDRDDLGYFLEQIFEKVKDQEAEALKIKERLDGFGIQLAQDVVPAIKLKLSLINSNTLGSEIKALQTKIDTRALAIEEKNKEYKKLVEQAITAAVGNMIMMIYSSVEAEKIRKERNRLTKEQEKDIALMERKSVILASLSRVRMDFQNLDLIVIDADIATKNLISAWNELGDYIDASIKGIKKIDNGLSMRGFKTNLNLVISPWEKLEKKAILLKDVFAAADREFKEEYGV